MKLIGVECWADKYFFGRLLNDNNLIRKEKNKQEVIKGAVVRSKGNFSIGIIDIDDDNQKINGFERIFESENSKILKHNSKYQFLILIGPKEFENWIEEYLKTKNVNVKDFGFIDFNDFKKKSKTIKPESDERFRNLINYIFENFNNDENHILKLKKQLEYILQKKYQFKIDEFQKI